MDHDDGNADGSFDIDSLESHTSVVLVGSANAEGFVYSDPSQMGDDVGGGY